MTKCLSSVFGKVLVCYLGNSINHVFYVVLCHLGVDRQGDDFFIPVLSDRTKAWPSAKPSLVIRMQMHRYIMDVDPNSLCSKSLKDFGTVNAQFAQIEADNIEVVGVEDMLSCFERGKRW